MEEIKVTKLTSLKGEDFLVQRIEDDNTIPEVKVFKKVNSAYNVAEEDFGISPEREKIGNRSKKNTREMWNEIFKKGTFIFLIFSILSLVNCSKKLSTEQDFVNPSTKNTSPEVTAITTSQKQTSIDENYIIKGVWSSNTQFSTPYMQNGIYDTVTNIIFEKDGSLTVFEGSSVKSCECQGKYDINEIDQTLVISGVENKNCSWLSMVNGSYTLTKDILDSYTNKKNGIRFDFYQNL